MPTTSVKVVTDENGYHQKSDHFDPPGRFPLKIELKAKLLSPAATTITGNLDIDAANGSTQNQSKDFVRTPDTVWQLLI
jgi:hypothetical protein